MVYTKLEKKTLFKNYNQTSISKNNKLDIILHSLNPLSDNF